MTDAATGVLTRTRPGSRPGSSRARRTSTTPVRRTESPPRIRVRSTRSCWPSFGGDQVMHAPRRQIGGVTVPDTPLVARAMEEARAVSEPYLFNHAVRSWLFAVRLAEQGTHYDEEVVAVSSLLHDLGLTKSCKGERRFEVEGADAARTFARAGGVDERRAQLIWYCVALNATLSISPYAEPEVGICTLGAGVDFAGLFSERIPRGEMASILAAYPRLELKRQLTDCLRGLARSRPQTTYDNFIRDFGERFVPGYKPTISTVDLLLNAPFPE